MKAAEKKPEAYVLIVGSGEAKSSVVTAGLQDIFASYTVQTVTTAWYEYAAGMQNVQDVLMDSSVPWYIVASNDSKVVPRFAKCAEDVMYVELGESTIEEAVISQGHWDDVPTDTLVIALLLWDDEAPEVMEGCVVAADAAGIKVLDLTNGLVPIVLEEDEVAPEEPIQAVPTKKQETDTVDISDQPFTEDELLSMPVATLKRMASAQGLNTTGMNKAALVEWLSSQHIPASVPTLVPPIELDDDEEEMAPSNVLNIPVTSHPSQMPVPVSVVVVYSSGASIVLNLDSPLRQIVEAVLSQYTSHKM